MSQNEHTTFAHANVCANGMSSGLAIMLTLTRVSRGRLGEYVTRRAVPWLRSLVTGLSLRRPGFAPGSIHVGFVADKVSLGQVLLRVLRFSPANISSHCRPTCLRFHFCTLYERVVGLRFKRNTLYNVNEKQNRYRTAVSLRQWLAMSHGNKVRSIF
jgi:hypothetical protein